jgi:putative transposase
VAYTNTIFQQLLHLLDRNDFLRIERQGFHPKRRYRTLSRWGQLVAMMFAHLTNRSSLRDISRQLEVREKGLYHLGVERVKRSTLADANSNRSSDFFKAIFYHQYDKCSRFSAGKKKFRFKNKLYSLDASVVDLCLSLYPWAKFRTTKGGIKLHTLLDHDGYIPAFVSITDAKRSDIAEARTLKLPPYSIVVMDRAYLDFAWFNKLTQRKTFFVIRLKKGVQYTVRERQAVQKSKGITSDQIIGMTGPKGSEYHKNLRRVGYKDPETGQHYVYLTNIFHLSAKTIADIYRERWQVELFFKWIKQNLKIKSFLGTSKNAVMTQIWIALITLLLLYYYKFISKLNHSLTQILRILQLNLFRRQYLWQLFDPGPTERMLPNQIQLSINFSNF